jgi:hypothetical protein
MSLPLLNLEIGSPMGYRANLMGAKLALTASPVPLEGIGQRLILILQLRAPDDREPSFFSRDRLGVYDDAEE